MPLSETPVSGDAGDRPRLFLTRRLPEAVEARAAAAFTLHTNPTDTPQTDEVLLAAIAAFAAEALLVCPADRLSAALIAALPGSVRIIATFSAGTDHIALPAARARGLWVTNTPDVLTDATAEVAMLLMLGAARRAGEGEAMIRAATWSGWAPTQMMGRQLTGKRLGIFGMGRIGQAVAARAQAFGMTVLYSNRTRLPPALERGATFFADPEAMLGQCDVLSLNCPATPETHHWLDARRLALLAPQAIVVNTARGTVVDDAALIAALRRGQVFAAGLDVYAGEPDLDPGYRTLPNTFLLPHLGSATVETRNAMGWRALANLETFFAGGAPADRVV